VGLSLLITHLGSHLFSTLLRKQVAVATKPSLDVA